MDDRREIEHRPELAQRRPKETPEDDGQDH
jgi:hypothetical protein